MTGTPGTGKSTVAALLPPTFTAVEVGALALSYGCGRKRGSTVEIDLHRLCQQMATPGAPPPAAVIVGHVAHLLPVREAIVLRCHPQELLRRLRRAHRGGAADRLANFVSEATDGVLIEALSAGLRVYEIDTTGRTPRSVASEVARRLVHAGAPRFGRVDWLNDRVVTAHLLDRPE